MATFLTNPLPASDAKIRFMEPYVSNGLNRRTVGIVPEGVYRGFDVSALLTTVTIAADITTMDSVAVCETFDEALAPNQFQLTVRHEGDIVLDFSGLGPADYPNAIVLETIYDLTGTSPLTGVTSVNIKVLDLVDVLPEHVVLCQTTKVGPNVIIDNTNREDLGGPLATQADVNATSISVDSMSDGASGVFISGSMSPVFTAIPGASLPFVQAATSDILFNFTAFSPVDFFGDNVSTYAVRIDAGAWNILTRHFASVFSLSVGVQHSGALHLPAIAAGPHTLELGLAWLGGFSGQARCDRSSSNPLRMSVLHK